MSSIVITGGHLLIYQYTTQTAVCFLGISQSYLSPGFNPILITWVLPNTHHLGSTQCFLTWVTPSGKSHYYKKVTPSGVIPNGLCNVLNSNYRWSPVDLPVYYTDGRLFPGYIPIIPITWVQPNAS